jgi:hypothetical protein
MATIARWGIGLKGLIGYTGFVGGTLCGQQEFDLLYNSSNIGDIAGQELDLLICAGAPGLKWKANKEPVDDEANLRGLLSHLQTVKAKSFVLISTVDVYPRPFGVDEDSFIDENVLEPYGKNRYMLEREVRKRFPSALVMRLPGLYGRGLKKNAIYDLMHDNALHLIHKDSVLQYYGLRNLSEDISKALSAQLTLVNMATEPVCIADVARRCFDRDFDNVTESSPPNYNMQTNHAAAFGKVGRYIYSADCTFEQIRLFAQSNMAPSV